VGRSSEEQTKLLIQVKPGSRRNEVVGFQEGVLSVRIAASPIKGRANEELVSFLSQLLDISRSCIRIEKGLTSRRKLLFIEGLPKGKVLERLSAGQWA